MTYPKNVFLQKDLGEIGEYLHSYKNQIRKEFIANSKLFLSEDYFTKEHKQEIISKITLIKSWVLQSLKWSNFKEKEAEHLFVVGNWKMQPILYEQKWCWGKDSDNLEIEHNGTKFSTVSAYNRIKQNYPITLEMVEGLHKKYGRDCVNKATFSILAARGHIAVHTGLENIDSKYVRCHIPIVIPEHTKDELYLEVNADKVHWTETYGFDNQTFHTARNATPYNRLVFLIDISRKALNLPPKPKVNKLLGFFKRYYRILMRKGIHLN
jgi:hypothetical protein